MLPALQVRLLKLPPKSSTNSQAQGSRTLTTAGHHQRSYVGTALCPCRMCVDCAQTCHEPSHFTRSPLKHFVAISLALRFTRMQLPFKKESLNSALTG
eukprot:3908836-Amphidinium_carterae.2